MAAPRARNSASAPKTGAPAPPAPLGKLLVLLVTAFSANAFIMSLELVAGRLVARFLGQSLYTWTAIVGGVLLGMSIGSYLGGRLVDRRTPSKLLPVLLLLAAAACPAVLILNEAVGRFPLVREFAWPARILVHVLVTFLIPSIFLGSITPVILREALRIPAGTGRIIGMIYGASAFGSVIGTFGTGFVLVPHMGTRMIVLLLGAGLGAFAVYFARAAMRETTVAPQDDRSHEKESSTAPLDPRVRRALVAVFIANASFMVYELAASRLATQALGHTIYTWTSLLGIVLAGIMVGNYIGGRLSDRSDPDTLLPWFFSIAALTALVSLGVHRILSETLLLDGWTWVQRIFIHIALAFFVPSVAMGTIGPAAARKAISISSTPGRTVGLVYATGSIASVAATFATGYFLVDLLWPIGTILLLSVGLAGCGVFFSSGSRTAWPAVAITGLALVIAVVPGEAPYRVARALGLAELNPKDYIYRDHSQYSWIAVSETPGQPSSRSLYLDQLLHSTTDLNDPLNLEYEYEQIYQAVMDVSFPIQTPIRASVIGGGGFVYPRYLELTRTDSYIETVEIDPAVTEAAHAAFGLPRDTRIAIYEMDARNRIEDLVREDGEKFDCIFGDSFNQYSVPFQLTTLEFNRHIYNLLNNNGIYFMNMIESTERGAFLGSVVRTMREVFPVVYAMRSDAFGTARDTFVVIGSKRTLDLESIAESMRQERDFVGGVMTDGELDAIIARNGSPLLTDDFAPVDNMVGPLINTKQSTQSFQLRRKAVELIESGKTDEALPMMETLHRLEPWDIEVVRDIAFIYARIGEHRKAQPYFELAVRMAPTNFELRYNLGLLYAQMSEGGNAIRELSAARALRPNDTGAAFALGSALNAAERPQEALEHLQHAVKLDPDNASGRFMLANTLAVLKQFEGAKTEFAEVLRIAPDFPGARENLARVHLNLNEYADAREQYVRILEQEPNNPVILFLFGVTLEAEGQPGEAIEYYRLALEINPNLEDAKAALERATAKSESISPEIP